MTETQGPEQSVPWPNQQEPLDGVEPTADTPQDPDFLEDDKEQYDYEQEMED